MKENKLLKLQNNDEIFINVCEKQIRLTQEKIDEISSVARKIAEFEDEVYLMEDELLTAAKVEIEE